MIGKLFFFIVLLILFASPSYALIRVYGASPSAIGGISVGTQGVSGIYSGYTLAAGDNLTSSTPIVNIANPLNRYFPTIAYSNGTRGSSSLAFSYDSDPYNPGHQDANRGVPLVSNTITTSGSPVTLLARIENSTETGKIGSGRNITDGMLHTAGYVTFSTPAILEAYVKFPSSSLPNGWHPSFWIANAFPISTTQSSASEEFDFESNGGNGIPTAFNIEYYQHGSAPSCCAASGSFAGFDNTWHLFSMVMTSSGNNFYVDGTYVGGAITDTTATTQPFYALFTNHTLNGSDSTWTGLGSSGVSYQLQWYRIWIKNAQYPSEVITPTQNLPHIQVAYNTSMTYNFPSATALWGSNITDYCQAIPFEDYEPGCSVSFNCGYNQFPAGLTYSSRTLTGVTSDQEPGRIHTSCMPGYVSGGALGYTARGYIDVGPNVTETTASYSNATGSLDVYFVGNCGDLLPKTISITGLPTGLSFSPTTNLITGTAITGSYIISYSVTNSVGQNATQSITLTVGS